jgi:regulator of protease activity HflC (stomatin/prohibitin superfamily)
MVIILMIAFCGYGCVVTRVDAGYTGIKINLAGSGRGVSNIPIVTGWVFYNPLTTKIIKYPVFVQTVVWTSKLDEGHPIDESLTFNSDGQQISANISLSYQISPEYIPKFYSKFRLSDIDGFTHGFLRNVARDYFNEVASTLSVEDVLGGKKTYLVNTVKDKLNESLKQYGITVVQFGLIGSPEPPESIKKSIADKISATQNAIRTEKEVRQSRAEADKKVAKAKGDADAIIMIANAQAQANQIIARSLTSELVSYTAITKWDGKLPTYSGGGAVPFLNISTK